jgi:hypothetical protein
MNSYNILSQEILERISRHCPEALYAYIQCLNRANGEGTVFFSKDLVEVNMSHGWSKFRNQIKKLALENILEWHPFNNGISVTMVSLDADE